ncbi:MAG: indolepyruvate ferredoxin oxidoreductase subunit alpha [Thermodesulfobacteriota bacterium]|nr:indolepyruvate ferredoxin oxidoreductase subunit alpha [Thermodesulfobacteriota bacterium]
MNEKRILLSGNEAVARGAYESGVKVAAAYPGTPSTEILENIRAYKGIYAEWSPNEKVALEMGMGAAFAGARALVAMKHVGVNVAADPLFTMAYTGLRGGLVLVTADDPEMHSSQNEQDSRNYAKFAKVPMLEPSDSQEAKDFTGLALELSERFDTPVMLRSTTRISHSKSIVLLKEPAEQTAEPKLVKDPLKFVMLPANARKRHPVVEKRMEDLSRFAETFPENRIEWGENKIGIITSGISYQYAKEVMPEASYLKLGMVYPLPQELIRSFASRVEKLFVVEDLDPFIEEQVRAMGIAITGKAAFPLCGELTPALVAKGLKGFSPLPVDEISRNLPARPPIMCPGCPHRGIFSILSKLKLYVTGDIGCYTLGFLPPLSAIDTCVCMGASIGNALGLDKALGEEALGKVVAVIGDSTFLHSGITGLLDVAYNKGAVTLIILDNHTTAMTGRQDHPGTGFTLKGEEAFQVDLVRLAKVLGVKHVKVVNPYQLAATERVIKREVKRPEPSVIISQAPCVLSRRERAVTGKPFLVNSEVCTGCRACLRLGCPAIMWVKENENEAGGKKRKGRALIDHFLCNGCTLCEQVCKFSAIKETNGQ